jgi:phosphodiesterase/alkaline phosphatase D-like protein
MLLPTVEELTATSQSGAPSLTGELRIMAGPIAQDVTDHSAMIFWLTSREAAMNLKYGLNQRELDQTGTPETPEPRGRNAGQQHQIVLKNLQPAQNYFFEILDEQRRAQATGQFQTEPSEFAQMGKLKIIDGPVFEYLTETSVQIAWTTNAQSSTLVRYGTDPNDLRKAAPAPWGQETHRVEITGLDPDTKYYFVVESAQARDSGTMAKSAAGSFRTERQGEAALTNIAPRR